MWTQFYLEQLHFALDIFAALVFFSVFWLYFDAWTMQRTVRKGMRMIGFFFLSVSFLIHAVTLESSVVPQALVTNNFLPVVYGVFRAFGYIFIIIGLSFDPIQPKPSSEEPRFPSAPQSEAPKAVAFMPFMTLLGIKSMPLGFFLFSLLVGLLYLRRAIRGLERHLLPIAVSFFVFSLYELLQFAAAFRDTNNVFVYSLVALFGPLWLLGYGFLTVALIILVRWVFGYLLKRFETQLFIIFTLSVVFIYIIVTLSFTTLLLRNMQSEVLRGLATDVRVLSFALESKFAETLSDAQVLAQNPAIPDLLSETSHTGLRTVVEQYFLSKRESFLAVTGPTGQVLARGDDRDRFGESLSDDPLVQRALLGESASSVVVREGVIAPEISVRSAVPVRAGDTIAGAVLAGTSIDNAFVDGVKRATKLESTLYAGDQISATTLIASDGQTRPIGLREKNREVTMAVLSGGKGYQGTTSFLGRPYLGAYEPLKDHADMVVGMLYMGTPQSGVLATAGKSIELTFAAAVILLIASVFPAYVIAHSIASQVR